MTGPLRNTRHEAFVQLLLQGETAIDAHEKAGFVRDDGNSARLKASPKVQERLAELQAEIAGATKVTVASLLDELEEARKRADSLDQLSAVVKAISEKARISGLMVQKIEVGAPGDFSKCETIEAVVDELLRYGLDQFHPATEADRKGLVAIYERHAQEVDEFVASIKARPVVGVRVDRPAIGNGFRRY